MLPGQDIDRETLAFFPFGQTVSSSADAEQCERRVKRNAFERTDRKAQIFASSVRAVRTHTPVGNVPRTSLNARASNSLFSELGFDIECDRPIYPVQILALLIVATGHKCRDRKPPNSKWLHYFASHCEEHPQLSEYFRLSIAMSRFSFNECFGGERS